MNKQVVPIHIVAFFLTPQNYQTPLTPHHDSEVHRFFQRYVTLDQTKIIYFKFKAFRHRFHPFVPSHPRWDYINDPQQVWLVPRDCTQLIATFAGRLFNVPANSVPSEQSFSVEHFIHNKTRSVLRVEKVNKMSYIYMNGRKFIHGKGSKGVALPKDELDIRLHNLNPKQEIKLEDSLYLSDGDQGIDDLNEDLGGIMGEMLQD
jgi:hypothetical protein